MRLFVDCEFNGFKGQLISMALVSEDGREWYEVLPLPDAVEPWVADNVVPHLGKDPLQPKHFRASFLKFVEQFNNPIICADWYTDLFWFFDMFAGEDHMDSAGYACRAELRLLPGTLASAKPHNALEDARAIKAAWA